MRNALHSWLVVLILVSSASAQHLWIDASQFNQKDICADIQAAIAALPTIPSMSRNLSDDEFLERIAIQSEPDERGVAPSRLKSRIYSALMRRQAETGPLLGLQQTKASGHDLCVFEELVRIAPVGEAAKCLNLCRVCHARMLGEKLEHPPIYWPNCPYVRFKKS